MLLFWDEKGATTSWGWGHETQMQIKVQFYLFVGKMLGNACDLKWRPKGNWLLFELIYFLLSQLVSRDTREPRPVLCVWQEQAVLPWWACPALGSSRTEDHRFHWGTAPETGEPIRWWAARQEQWPFTPSPWPAVPPSTERGTYNFPKTVSRWLSFRA